MARRAHVTLAGGPVGPWRVDSLRAARGTTLSAVERLAICEGPGEPALTAAVWLLRGVPSNERYVTKQEHAVLASAQAVLGRPGATRAALIPVHKTEEWWDLSQDERRSIFEEQSRHIAIGIEYLPAVARQLYHSRDLDEPFDFLTWFEFAPADAPSFEELVQRLRATREWAYVDREVDIRLTRDGDISPLPPDAREGSQW